MIQIVTASAGTGKTYRLTQVLTRAIVDQEVEADRIMATTFTVKAAQELVGRTRSSLLTADCWDDAQALGASLIGTVNAIGGRLLSEFAFELGLAPVLDVLAEEDTLLCVQEALEDVLQLEPQRTQVADAAAAFGIQPSEWQSTVRHLLYSARANRVAPDDLAACGVETADDLVAFLSVPNETDDLDRSLLVALDEAWERFGGITPQFKNQQEALDTLRDCRRSHEEGGLRWSQWAKLSKIEGGKKWEGYLQGVRVAAATYMQHPRLRRQIREFVLGLYRFAAAGMDRYRSHKERLRLIDYGDQEERLLELLESDEHRLRIADRVGLLLVDEFQDTSPLQLAIFLKLAEIVPRSVWVGDAKQSIYRFRGADPQLMASCQAHVEDCQELDTSYRSRPDLVEFVGAVFAPQFGRQGIPCLALRAHRRDRADLPPVLSLWGLETENRSEDWLAISRGIQELMDRPDPFRLEDPVTGSLRPVRPADIVVLCRRREGCRNIAEALSTAGFQVAIQQAGILESIEGRLAEAGLRLLLDPGDAMAAATISFLDRPEGRSADDWLADRIRQVRDDERPWNDHPRVAAVLAARPRIVHASPWEALDLALEALDLPTLCLSFPQGAQRLANLEALRGLATAYEERCRVLRMPASPAGLLVHLRRLNRQGRDEGISAEGADAIQVSTYHGAKGLEWPVVVLTELDTESPDAWMGITVRSRGAFTMSNPLTDRFVRYWFSPFGLQSVGIPYLDRLRASEVGQDLARCADEEAVRLLYVGFTRARDHLVLASRVKDGRFLPAQWLNQVLTLPPLPRDGLAEVFGTAALTCTLGPAIEPVHAERDTRWFDVGQRPAAPLRAAVTAASSIESEGWVCGDVVTLGERIRVAAIDDREIFGTAVHAFLAAESEASDRQALAEQLLISYGYRSALEPEALVLCADRLAAFVAERYPGAVWRREWPVAYRHEDQEVWGQADLLLETVEGWVVVDYKSFEGAAVQAAASFGGQLHAYATGLSQATGREVIGLWIYQVLVGRMVQVRTVESLNRTVSAGMGRSN